MKCGLLTKETERVRLSLEMQFETSNESRSSNVSPAQTPDDFLVLADKVRDWEGIHFRGSGMLDSSFPYRLRTLLSADAETVA